VPLGGNGVAVENSGDMNVTATYVSRGIIAIGVGPNSATSVVNSGDLVVTSTTNLVTPDTQAKGIYAGTNGVNSALSVVNSGDITVRGVGQVYGIQASTGGPYSYTPTTNSPVVIENSGDIRTSGTGYVDIGIVTKTFGANSAISVTNSRRGILAASFGANSTVTVVNSGTVALTGESTTSSGAIITAAFGAGSNIVINNSGTLQGAGYRGVGIYALTPGTGHEPHHQLRQRLWQLRRYPRHQCHRHDDHQFWRYLGGQQFGHQCHWCPGLHLQQWPYHRFRRAHQFRRYLH
jgi:hypothetical protein